MYSSPCTCTPSIFQFMHNCLIWYMWEVSTVCLTACENCATTRLTQGFTAVNAVIPLRLGDLLNPTDCCVRSRSASVLLQRIRRCILVVKASSCRLHHYFYQLSIENAGVLCTLLDKAIDRCESSQQSHPSGLLTTCTRLWMMSAGDCCVGRIQGALNGPQQ